MDTPEPLSYRRLRDGGLSHRDIDQRVRGGSLRKLRHGIYWAPGEIDGRARHLALLRGTGGLVDGSNVVSHQSAAVLHDLPLPTGSLSSVTMTRLSSGHGDTGNDLRVRQTPLSPEEITMVDGIAVTTLARTAVDLAKVLPYEWGVAACDAALARGLSPWDLSAAVGRYRRLKGLPLARQAVAFADSRSESPAESLSRVAIARAGLPLPRLQVELFDRNGILIARPDFLWEGVRLVGEVDGRWKYDELLRHGETSADVIMREKRREEAIRQAGYWIVRWDWKAIVDGTVASLVRQAILHQAAALGVAAPLPC